MIRIASVFAPQTPPAMRSAPPQLPQRAPLLPPVTPPNAAEKQPSDHPTAQSEAAFALVLSRASADAPKATARYEPQFADPLPDLPSVDLPEHDAPSPMRPAKSAP